MGRSLEGVWLIQYSDKRRRFTHSGEKRDFHFVAAVWENFAFAIQIASPFRRAFGVKSAAKCAVAKRRRFFPTSVPEGQAAAIFLER
ncbi:MAG: hypothetical protein WCF79_20695 [Rhodomicrobium sp.]